MDNPMNDLKYSKFSIVDSGGFSGRPGEGYTVPKKSDPRSGKMKTAGKNFFHRMVSEIVREVEKKYSQLG